MVLTVFVACTLWFVTQDPAASESIDELLRAGKLEQAVEESQRRFTAQPDNPSVKQDFLRLHMALAAQMMRDQQFAGTERVLAAVLKADPNHAEAKRLQQSIADARAAVPARLVDARRWLRLEWNEAAYEAFDQACALLPDRRHEWIDDLLKAAEGAADDHYFCKNFHQAFYYYDAVIRSGRTVSESLRQRWMQSLVLSLGEDVDRVHYPIEYWHKVVTGAEERVTRRSDPLLALLRGLANENLEDADRAAANYAEAGGQVGSNHDAAGLREARESALAIARRQYDPALSARRNGFWARTDAGDFKQIEGAHFRVHHRNADVGRRVAESLDEHFGRVATFLGRKPEQIPWPVVCDVYVHKDLAALRRATKRGGDVRGLSIMTLAGGKLHSQVIHVTQNDPLLLAVTLPHEVMHLVIGAITSYRTVPAVLDEGMALHVETRCRATQFRRVLASGGAPRPVKTLLAVKDVHPAGEQRFYAEAFRLVDVLLSRGTAAQTLDAAMARDAKAALLKVFRFRDMADLDSAMRGSSSSRPSSSVNAGREK